jgi:DNA polymerase III alpha subunit
MEARIKELITVPSLYRPLKMRIKSFQKYINTKSPKNILREKCQHICQKELTSE